MKGLLRLVALILALSVILSTLAFTVAASDIATGAGVDIDQDIELFTPNAHYTVVDTDNVTTVLSSIKGSGSQSTGFGPANLYGGKDVDTYLVEDDAGNSYVMIVPAEQAVKTGNVTNHVQINTYIKKDSIYSDSTTPRYYVYDVDVATESSVLPLFYQFVTRKSGNGIWSTSWQPFSDKSSIYMTMTPGVFHRLTLIGDAHTNTAYVFIDNELVTTVANGVMSAEGHTDYLGSSTVNLEGMRVQLNSGVKNLNSDMSLMLDNITDRALTASGADNLDTCLESGDLSGWTANTYNANDEPARLPDMVEINGVCYNNTVDASAALNTHKAGNVVKLLRSVYSGAITVNCDATINTYSADVSLKAGKNVTLAKKSTGVWTATVHTADYTSTLVQSGASTITNYVKYDAEDNLISGIGQNHAFTDTTLSDTLKSSIIATTVNGDIRSTVDGNEYFIVYDNSGAESDFGIYDSKQYEVHYQVNAHVALMTSDDGVSNFSDYAIAEHELVVFDYDLYSESKYINIYSGFNLRDKTNAPVSALALYARNPDEVLMRSAYAEEKNTVELEAGCWNHLTFIAVPDTGTMYVYVNGSLAITVEYALYTAEAKESIGLENMCLGSFRTMQIANQPINGEGGNFASKYLTPEHSVASDNYYLRFVDSTNYTAGMESLSDWNGNVYNDDYISPALPALARVDGVEYYDVESINAILNDTDYTTPKREVEFLREFIGTVTVNCRAVLNLNGIGSSIEYGEGCVAEADASNGSIINVYKHSPKDTEGYEQNVTEAWDSQKLFAVDGSTYTDDSILAAVRSDKDGNIYNAHVSATKGASGPSWLALQLVDKEYSDYLYLLDAGKQTHTLTPNNISLTPNYTMSATISDNSSLTSSSSTITAFSSTEEQVYLITEFDIAKMTVGSNKSTLSAVLEVDGTDKVLTVIGDLGALCATADEFAHVSVVGELLVTPTISVTRTEKSNVIFTTYSYAASVTGYAYTVQFKVYVDNVLTATTAKTELASGSSAASIAWTGMNITNADGNELAYDNVYMAYGVETVTTESSGRFSMDTSDDAATNGTNLQSAVESNLTPTESGDTAIDEVFESESIESDAYGMTDDYTMPTTVTDKKTEVVVGTETVPAVNYPIACVWTEDESGETVAKLYYADDEEALVALLSTTATETVEVIILREPTEALEIATNAIVDTNGIDGAITVSESDRCVVNTDGDTTQVVVIGNTDVLLCLNGVDYTAADLTEVQTLLDLAHEAVTLEFYSTPSTALHITSAATIETNGLSDLYYLDAYGFTETVSGTSVIIEADTRVGTVSVNVYVNGTTYIQHISEPLPYGTNINDYLRGKGMLGGTFVIDGTVWTASTYDATFDDAAPHYVSSPSVTYTATPTKSSNADYVYVDASGNLKEAYVTDDGVATTLAGWFAQSGDSTLVLNADWSLANTVGSTANSASSGVKNIYLNGHTVSLDVNTTSHVWSISGSSDYNFYGDGTLNFVKNTNTQAIFFGNWGYSGTITFSGVTINTSYAIGQLRDGNMVLKDCKINSFITNDKMSGLISLGEDYNNNYTSAPQTLVITGCEIVHRFAEVADRYKSRTKNIPLISHKIVQLAADQETTVIIDDSYIRAQGSIIRADQYNSETGDANAYLDSNMKLFINDSTIIARSVYTGSIKAGSIIFYDDVRTNLDDTKGISFASSLLKAKTSDGLASILYTSHDYATVTWSDGETELWAGGSVPTREVTKYDDTDFVSAGEVRTFTETTSSLSFSLLGNLTLSDTIGFNIYIPESVAVNAVYMDSKLVSPIAETTYVTKAGAWCYCYSIELAPQEAVKTFTVMIALADGTRVTRSTSIGQYAENLVTSYTSSSGWLTTDEAKKTKALLSAVLGYVEQATMYAGYNVEILKCSTVLSKAGFSVQTPTGTAYDTSALSPYISGAQINIADTVRFRFNLQDGVDPSSITFEVIDDAGTKGVREAVLGDGWVELSLRAYEINKDITITVSDTSANYNLYTYYTALSAMAGTSSADQYESTSALRLIQQLYTYAAIADEQLARYNEAN